MHESHRFLRIVQRGAGNLFPVTCLDFNSYERLNDPPSPNSVVFIIARSFVHYGGTFFPPERHAFVVPLCRRIPRLWERTESSYPGDSQGEDLLLCSASQ